MSLFTFVLCNQWKKFGSLLVLKRHSSSNNKESVLINKVGQVVTIGINRPEKRNCIDNNTASKLYEAFSNFENDIEMKAAVLYGVGGNFCSGFDLQELSKTESLRELKEEEGPMGPTRMFLKKPLVAAVSGYAVAGGLELALLADLRVVEETAVLGVFSRRFGVPLIDGGTVRLPALIGLSRALDLILTGRPIKAKEALECGLANRIVACGTALGQAINLATSLVKFPQACMLADRRSAYYSVYSGSSYKNALSYEAENFNLDILTEAITGARKFIGGTGRHGKFSNITEIPSDSHSNK